MSWQQLRWTGEYFAVRLFICIVQALPISACQRCAELLGWLCADILMIRRKITLDNLRSAFPDRSEREISRMCRKMYQHLFLMLVEIAFIPRKIHETNWRSHIKLVNGELVTKALLAERPTIVISAHFGNFELASFALGMLGFPSFSVARPLDNPYLDAFVHRFRSYTGQTIINSHDGYDDIVKVLDQQGTIAFLADQNAGRKGCIVEFFGREASAHKAISLFSLQHDTPMVVCYTRRTGKPLQYELVCQSVADPRDESAELETPKSATQWYTTEIEKFVNRAPDQYWWLHDRWKLPERAGKKRRRRRKKVQNHLSTT